MLMVLGQLAKGDCDAEKKKGVPTHSYKSLGSDRSRVQIEVKTGQKVGQAHRGGKAG